MQGNQLSGGGWSQRLCLPPYVEHNGKWYDLNGQPVSEDIATYALNERKAA